MKAFVSINIPENENIEDVLKPFNTEVILDYGSKILNVKGEFQNSLLFGENEIFTTEIQVKKEDYGWSASCEWQCGGFAEDGSMVGTIATKYCENTLSDAIDYVLNCMKQMNVKRSDEIDKLKDILGFALYSSGNPDEFCDIVNEANVDGNNTANPPIKIKI